MAELEQRRFRVTRESPDLVRDDGEPHIRVTSLLAVDEDAARRYVERQEMAIAAHEYHPAALAELEAQEAAAVAGATAARDAAGEIARDAAVAAGLTDDEVDAAARAAEDAIPAGRAPATVRMQLATHRQQQPYVITTIEEVE